MPKTHTVHPSTVTVEITVWNEAYIPYLLKWIEGNSRVLSVHRIDE